VVRGHVRARWFDLRVAGVLGRLVLAVALVGIVVAAAAAPAEAAEPAFQTCRDRAFTPDATRGWRHWFAGRVTPKLGHARHAAADAIEPDAAAVVLRAKFAYGRLSKDLQGESVRIWIDDCAGWHLVGDAITDDDGRIAVALPAGVIDAPGVYEVRYQVHGDRSTTTARVWLLPAGTRIVVADVDGTLTTGDRELVHELADGHRAKPAPSAAALTTAHAERGHVVVYLTGRPYLLARRTRAWLDDLGFAAGPVIIADRLRQAFPSKGGVGVQAGADRRADRQGLRHRRRLRQRVDRHRRVPRRRRRRGGDLDHRRARRQARHPRGHRRLGGARRRRRGDDRGGAAVRALASAIRIILAA
jgi:hypothetical protein